MCTCTCWGLHVGAVRGYTLKFRLTCGALDVVGGTPGVRNVSEQALGQGRKKGRDRDVKKLQGQCNTLLYTWNYGNDMRRALQEARIILTIQGMTACVLIIQGF